MNSIRPSGMTSGSLSKMNVVVIGLMSVPSGFMPNRHREGELWYSSNVPIRVEVNARRPSGNSTGSMSWNAPEVSCWGLLPSTGTR